MASAHKTMNNLYQAYSLTIASELDLPELPPGFGDPDVTIRFGYVPPFRPDLVIGDSSYCHNSDENAIYCKVSGLAGFKILAGRQITVDSVKNVNEAMLRIHILSSLLAVISHQRGRLALHAGALVLSGNGVAITGASGAGKSTLTSALAAHGFLVLADDICVLKQDHQGLILSLPSYPMLKVDVLGAQLLGCDVAGLDLIDAEACKYGLPVMDRFAASPAPLKVVIEMIPGPYARPRLVPVTGAEIMPLILNNTFRPQVFDVEDHRRSAFILASQASRQISAFRCERPDKGCDPHQLTELVLEAVRTNIPNQGEHSVKA